MVLLLNRVRSSTHRRDQADPNGDQPGRHEEQPPSL
jgi:hypothetical protein